MSANPGSIDNTPPDLSKLTLTRRGLLRSGGMWAATAFAGPLRLLASPVRATDSAAFGVAPPCLNSSPTRYPPPLQRFIDKLDPAADVFVIEVYVVELERQFAAWREALTRAAVDPAPPQTQAEALAAMLAPSIAASSLEPSHVVSIRADGPLRVEHRTFPAPQPVRREAFVAAWARGLASFSRVELAEFEIFGVRVLGEGPLRIETDVRYDLLGRAKDGSREQRTGTWTMAWQRSGTDGWLADGWTVETETRAQLSGPGFTEITAHILDPASPAATQLAHGIDHWRTVLDAAVGIDVYGNHGIAAGDIDGSGVDSLYICQPSGLPNRLLRNRGDGTFEDVTDASGTGLLDGTASALFADFQNRGRQDLLVVRSGGPMLFENMGGGRFEPRPNAFRFSRPPQGTFTSVAVADTNRDGLLDVYFCLYSYYQGLDQYQFPSPYYDAKNGPPNFLFRNRGDGTFDDITVASGMEQNNDRFSFAAEWCDFDDDGWPDLYVANDFGRKNLYRNNRDGTFRDVAAAAGVEDYGPGMSACWLDFDGDGRQDLYVANMWLREGRRITADAHFLPDVPEPVRALYRKHNAGNSMYRNRGDGTFADATDAAGTARCGWSWSCASWDFDNDGWPDLYVANGFVSGPNRHDLQSFFWRQIAQRSAGPAGASPDYEMAWNAVNELVRSDYSWSGYQRNVFFRNDRNRGEAQGGGSFSDVSGVLGLDLRDDSRGFALADFDGDGRLEFALKNRSGPQLRILRNDLSGIGHCLAVRLVGHASNRDAIGALVTVESNGRKQAKQLSAGSGFASQHTKELFFGTGESGDPVTVTVRWPNGSTSRHERVPLDRRVTIEEGKAEVHAAPFASTNPRTPAPLPTPAEPATIATWLAAPLFGPELSLPDAAGTVRTLAVLRGKPALLVLLQSGCGISAQQAEALERSQAALAKAGIAVFAVEVGAPGSTSPSGGSLPKLVATEEQLAAWNIQYRYLFDRRRDLSYPTTFLLDAEGAAACVYRGFAEPRQLVADASSLPSTAEVRLARATPYPGPYFGNPIVRDGSTTAVAFAEYGMDDAAIGALKQTLQQDPKRAAAWFNLGTLYLRRKQYAEAEPALQEAVRLNPQDSDAWNNLGMVAGERNDYATALDAFRKSALADPNHLVAVQNMLQIYQFQQRSADAQQAMQELVDKAPNNPDLHLGLAMAMLGQSNTAGGKAELETALRLRPDFPDALNNLGTVLLQTGDTAGALRAFDRCRQLAPDFDRPVLNEAVLYRRTGEPAKARDLLQQFLARHPENTDARGLLAKLGPQ